MKRTALLLLSLILVFCLSACSGSAQSATEPAGNSQSAERVQDATDSNENGQPVEQEQDAVSPNEESPSAEQGQGVTGSKGNSLPAEHNGNTDNHKSNNSDTSTTMDSTSGDQIDTNTENTGKVLVAFFSRTGENYGVGVIEKGNTHIIADMIAAEMDADTFEIARVTPYPEAYRDCTDEAQTEKSANARPELTATVDNFDDYDVIFLGYPIWWSDMPMPVYTFLESYDFSGKTVIPFCTHAGSGLSGTVQTLKNKLTGATVLDGLAIAGTTAQNSQDEAKQAVLDWLEKLDVKE